MKYLNTEDIKALCEKRIELIEKLGIGLLTKEEFIIENFQMIKLYKKVNYDVNSIDEGVLKYHYFNTMAKKLMLEADGIEFKDPNRSENLRDNAFDFYSKKDKITLNMLEFVGYKDVEAYFIHMKSRSLEGLIYEIRFSNLDKVVLHSKDRKILYKLKEANCFFDERMASVIDDYVNTKVY